MPNWCNNAVAFAHSDPAMIQRIVKGWNERRLFSEFFPVPSDVPNAIEWANNNWGTKWDTGINDPEDPLLVMDLDARSVRLGFDTAWGPPIQFYQKMQGIGFTVNAMYYEGGMLFCGSFTDGINQIYDVPNNSKLVSAIVPEAIDTAFDITNNIAMWEEEDAG